jgi:hypothetical protein
MYQSALILGFLDKTAGSSESPFRSRVVAVVVPDAMFTPPDDS